MCLRGVFHVNKDAANVLRKWKSCESGVHSPPLVNQSNGELGQTQFLEREQGHVTRVHSGERMAELKVTSEKMVRFKTAVVYHML